MVLPKSQPRYLVALAGVDTLKVSARGQLRQDAVDLLEALQQKAIEERDQRLHKGEAAVDIHWVLDG